MLERLNLQSFEEQAEYLMAGGAEVLPNGKSTLVEKLKTASEEKRPLRVKLGIDPTGSDLHLGHTVCLQVLRRFQKLGHLPVLLIGGFTAQLGDPTGRNEARPSLTESDVKENSKTFLKQIEKVIDLSKSEIVDNSDWLSNLSLTEVLKLASTTTINQLVGKEAFGERLEQGHPLYVHEIFYPILQGYDSVAIKADIELGGHDQRFNVLSGRALQKHFGQEPQIVMMFPLLIGLDGKKKMSKTSENYIAIQDSPNEMFGKTMSLPDEQLINWHELVVDSTPNDLKRVKHELETGANPRDIKMSLAQRIIEFYYNPEESSKAKEDFIAKFQKREIPDEIPEFKLNDSLGLIDVLVEAEMVSSRGEAKRMIAGQGVKVNSEKADSETKLKLGDVIQVGKRKFVKIV
ncbi:MAG: tyrosine--tRNA ligase [Candidatus Caenarcaniphilales bacterium]|nr:tyrosine--tRNA ligase [Candidatus Caenarcaniphilales bacterium]